MPEGDSAERQTLSTAYPSPCHSPQLHLRQREYLLGPWRHLCVQPPEHGIMGTGFLTCISWFPPKLLFVLRACVCGYECTCVHACMSAHVCVCARMHLNACTCVCYLCVCMYTHMCVYAHMRECLYVYFNKSMSSLTGALML